MNKYLEKGLKIFNKIEDYVGPVFLLIMCFSTFAQVVFRIIIKNPLLYTEEISRFSYIWCVYFCIAMGEKYQEHFCVDIFLKKVKGKANDLIYCVEKLIGCALFVFLAYQSVLYFDFQQIVKSAAIGLSMKWIALSMIIGFSLAFIRRLVWLVKGVRGLLGKGPSMINGK